MWMEVAFILPAAISLFPLCSISGGSQLLLLSPVAMGE
jgi:hypothetical protein